MLRHKADIRTVIYMAIVTSLLVLQWNLEETHWWLVIMSAYMSVSVAVIAHNHNHVPVWKSGFMNAFQDYWLTLFYGYPVFAWIPTHNANHHVYNNRAKDDTITYRVSEANNLLTLLSYPTISGWYQSIAVNQFVKDTWKKNRKKAIYFLSQAVLLVAYVGLALVWNWKKALLFIVVPQQVSLFSVLIFNYVQHVHADEDSKWNHSRNIVGPILNASLFNNGFHTVHHQSPLRHWSESPAAHASVAHLISPALQEKTFWGYIGRNYFLGLFSAQYRTTSMRLKRMGLLTEVDPTELDHSDASTAGV